MPIPAPRADETEDDFISRCMGDDDMQEYDQDQRAAICHDAWDNKNKGARLLSVEEFRARAKLGINALPGVEPAKLFRMSAGKPKALDDGSRKIRFCFSDGSVDRAGDTIDPAGWQLTNFLKNPVALWAHDSWSPPIGRASSVQIEGMRLVGDIEFADAETYVFADTIYRLTKNGYINAVSVGFLPVDYRWADEDEREWGIDFRKQELLEISVCPVPCNANALVEARAKGIDTKPLIEWAERMLDGGGKVIMPKAELEQLRKAAQSARAAKVHKDSASEVDSSSGGDVVHIGNCGREKDQECGMKNPAECSIHGPDYEDKNTMSVIRALVRAEVKRALGKDADGDNDDDKKPDGDLPADQQERVKSAYVHIKAAHEMHKDAVDLHGDGEHDAAMIMHRSIGALQRKAIDLLGDVGKDEGDDDNKPGDKPSDKPDEDDPEAKQARLRRALKLQEEARNSA